MNIKHVIVARILPPQVSVTMVKVSPPVHGAPPKGFCSMLASQRWHNCLLRLFTAHIKMYKDGYFACP